MKKIKPLLATMLAVSLALGCFSMPVWAESNKIEVKGTDYAKDVTVQGSYGVAANYFSLGSDTEVSYEVNIPKRGSYRVKAKACTPAKVVNTLRAEVGDQLKFLKVKTDGASDYKEFDFGLFNFEKGKNYINMGVELGETCYLEKLTFEYSGAKINIKTEGAFKEHSVPGIIQAEDFDLGDKGHGSYEGHLYKEIYRGKTTVAVDAVADEYMVTLRENDWTNYTFNVKKEGSYDVSVKTGYGDTIEMYFDNSIGCLTKETPWRGGETLFGTVYLEKGTHTVKLRGLKGSTKVDYIEFTESKEDGMKIKLLPKQKEVEEKEAVNPIYKNFYVSAKAKAGGNGTIERPFKTLEEAKAAVRKIRDNMTGDIVVNIMPGEYELYETFELSEEDGGKDDYKVIYRGMNALETPVISGGTRVSGWKEGKDGLWSVYLPDVEDMRQLYVNGYHAQIARCKYLYYPLKEYDDPETPEPLDGFHVSKVNFPHMSKPEDLMIVDNIVWTNQRLPVKNIFETDDTYVVVYDQPYFYYYNHSGWEHSNAQWHRVIYFENSFSLIDDYGEFYFDKDTHMLYYYPYPEEDMTTADTVIGRLEGGMLKAKGKSKTETIKNLSFENLDFRYGTWLDLHETGNLFYQADCLFPTDHSEANVSRYGPNMPGQLEFDCAENIEIKNCCFKNLGSAAIDMMDYVYNSEIVGNLFIDNSASAISIGRWEALDGDETIDDVKAANILIENNVIRRSGVEYYGSIGIGAYHARNVQILHNDIEDTPYTAITLGWGWGSHELPRRLDADNHTVAYNRIVDVSKVVKDGGHVYTLGDLRSTMIKENYFEKSEDAGGIYYDQGSAYIDAVRNVYIDCLNWFNSNSSQNHDNKNRNSYSDTTNQVITSTNGRNYEIDTPTLIKKETLSGKALAIKNNAGVEKSYSRLLKDTEYPEWRTNMNWNVPKYAFSGKQVIMKEVQDVKEGGEGVGYHTLYTKKGGRPNFGYHGRQPILGDTQPGEWCTYEVDILKTADYDFEFTYSQCFNGEYNDTKLPSKIALYVDNEKVFVSEELVNTGHWWNFVPINLTTLHLTEGRHEIKFEFVDRSVAVNKFMLIDRDVKGNEDAFDDGGKFDER